MLEVEPNVLHGGLVHEELVALGLRADDVLDVSVNVNPYGPCSVVRRAVAEARVDRYPDPQADPARRALAEQLRVDPERIVVGNGAVDLMWILARALLRADDRIVVVEPAFSEMRTASLRVGARVIEHRGLTEDGFAVRLEALSKLVKSVRPRVVYLATPSNPAGVVTPLASIDELARTHPETLWVADLSFLSLSTGYKEGDPENGSELSERVFWLRSLTKDHSLAGLRVGYAVAPPEIVRRLEQERPPWSVSAPAQAAAIATTTEAARRFVAGSRELLLRDRVNLVLALSRLSLPVVPSETIFSLIDVAPFRARDFARKLVEKHGVLVRDCASFGLPHHVRIAARPPAETDRVMLALTEELRT